MPKPTATMDDLDEVCAAYFTSRRTLLETAIATHLNGASANQIARRLAHVQGLSRNRILAVLAAGRRAYLVGAILNADRDYQDLCVELDEVYFDQTWISSVSEMPLGDELAHRLWTALARRGLTVTHRRDGKPADDPEQLLAALANLSPGTAYVVKIPTQKP